MAETTGISWTDHTHNEWWGCSSTAGAGCDHCYAVMKGFIAKVLVIKKGEVLF